MYKSIGEIAICIYVYICKCMEQLLSNFTIGWLFHIDCQSIYNYKLKKKNVYFIYFSLFFFFLIFGEMGKNNKNSYKIINEFNFQFY